MAKQCQICGKNSGMYPLCTDHFRMRDEGLVAKCEHCGKWYLTEEGCECQRPKFTELPLEGFDTCVVCGASTNGKAFCYSCWRERDEEEMLEILNSGKYYEPDEDEEEDEEDEEEAVIEVEEVEKAEESAATENADSAQHRTIIIDPKNRSKCIVCGIHTDGLLFCGACYRKYSKKSLLFRISNCREIDLLEADYEGRYTCKDGHVVKSKSEREIDNYLFEHGIPHAYEHALPYGARESDVLHPDFFLPDFLGKGKHVYIEHWGYDEHNLHYTKTKKFKMQIYQQLGITLVCTFEKTDMGNIDATLDRKLNPLFIQEGQINFDDGTK